MRYLLFPVGLVMILGGVLLSQPAWISPPIAFGNLLLFTGALMFAHALGSWVESAGRRRS